jgi:hypothetical protein
VGPALDAGRPTSKYLQDRDPCTVSKVWCPRPLRTSLLSCVVGVSVAALRNDARLQLLQLACDAGVTVGGVSSGLKRAYLQVKVNYSSRSVVIEGVRAIDGKKVKVSLVDVESIVARVEDDGHVGFDIKVRSGIGEGVLLWEQQAAGTTKAVDSSVATKKRKKNVWVAADDWTSGDIIKTRSVWRLLFTASRYATFACLESHGNKIAPLVSRLSSQDDYPEKGAQAADGTVAGHGPWTTARRGAVGVACAANSRIPPGHR